jgi:hypothetical protein
MATQNRRLAIMLLGITGILLLPLLAMQFTQEVNWTLFDFMVAGGLLLGACLAFEFLARRVATRTHRIVVGIAIGMILLLVWVELAVGIFGTRWAGS